MRLSFRKPFRKLEISNLLSYLPTFKIEQNFLKATRFLVWTYFLSLFQSSFRDFAIVRPTIIKKVARLEMLSICNATVYVFFLANYLHGYILIWKFCLYILINKNKITLKTSKERFKMSTLLMHDNQSNFKTQNANLQKD